MRYEIAVCRSVGYWIRLTTTPTINIKQGKVMHATHPLFFIFKSGYITFMHFWARSNFYVSPRTEFPFSHTILSKTTWNILWTNLCVCVSVCVCFVTKQITLLHTKTH